VILFDEVEKAHPDVVNVLLQLLDEGRLTDGQGRTVDFRNTLVVMTSNLGTELLADTKTEAQRRTVIDGALREHFRPEFLNRLDDVVIFRPLDAEDIVQIVDLQLALVAQRLSDRRITLKTSDAAKRYLAETGFDAQFGARPLKRTIQRLVVDPLTRALLAGEIPDGAEVKVGLESGAITVSTGSIKVATK
jgi:ATP-dependent Clp protease ATP-binding subunit ClpB